MVLKDCKNLKLVELKYYTTCVSAVQRFSCQYLGFVLIVKLLRLLLSGTKALQTCVSADAEVQVSVFVLLYSVFVLSYG